MKDTDKSILLAAACSLPSVRRGSLIGMAETVAWIAIRSELYCDAVRAYQQREIYDQANSLEGIFGEQRFIDANLWTYIERDADSFGHLNFDAARFEMMDAAQAGRIAAQGTQNNSGFDSIPRKDWIAARIIFGEAADTLAPFQTQGGIFGGEWGLVRFDRDAILERWPAISADVDQPENAVPPNVRDEECRRVAAALDLDKVRIRDVRAQRIAELWSAKAGPPPKISSITQFMEGGGAGGRPSAK